MKNLVLISNYYTPEIGAAANRISQLAKNLSKTYDVSVVCPLPNYPNGKIYTSYRKKIYVKETIDGVTINRLWVFPTQSKNKFLRLISMLSFSISVVLFLITRKVPKIIIVNSPPLLLAFTSLFVLKKKKHKIILNVSDLWPRSGLELGVFRNNFSYKMLKKIERHNYNKADLVLGQSEEILQHIRTIVNNKEVLLYRNFPNFKPNKIRTVNTEPKIQLVYAGLLGLAQGVLKLCEQLDYSKVDFHIYGSGAEAKKIESYINANPEYSITYYGAVSRAYLHQELCNYDITIVPLVNRIYGAVPSKIFEYTRLGLHILYLGNGEGREIVKKHNLGWSIDSGNYFELNRLINGLDKAHFSLLEKEKIQSAAMTYFDDSTQIEQLLNRI